MYTLVLYHDIIPKFIQFLLEDIVINIEVIVLYFIKNNAAKIIYNRTYKIYHFKKGIFNIIIHIR